MKREELLRFLRQQGCSLVREGARHSWWQNPSLRGWVRDGATSGEIAVQTCYWLAPAATEPRVTVFR